MNPFARHGITHLSPSSLNLWQAEPALWMLRYLHQFKDSVGPAAHRGSAVEAGLEHWLQHRDDDAAKLVALETFAAATNGLADDDHEAERELLEPMLSQACAALKDAPPVTGRQVAIETYLPGIDVPVIGYVDFVLEDGTLLELKTSQRLLTKPRLDHQRQVAIYAQAKFAPASILYVTAKKHATFQISDEDVASSLADITRIARSLRSVLAAAADQRAATEFTAPNFDSFYWSGDAKSQALKVWAL